MEEDLFGGGDNLNREHGVDKLVQEVPDISGGEAFHIDVFGVSHMIHTLRVWGPSWIVPVSEESSSGVEKSCRLGQWRAVRRLRILYS